MKENNEENKNKFFSVFKFDMLFINQRDQS